MTNQTQPTVLSRTAEFAADVTAVSSARASQDQLRARSASPVKLRQEPRQELRAEQQEGAKTHAGHPLQDSLQELLSLPAHFISGLPEPLALRLRVAGAPVPVVIWTGVVSSENRAASPVLADTIVFDGSELDGLATAAEADRLWHADFLGLCFEKWRRPAVAVREAELMGGANSDGAPKWSLGQVLNRLGIVLESIDFNREPVARPLHAAA